MDFNEIEKSYISTLDKVIENFRKQLLKVRTGQASSHLLDGVKVDYYGTPTPLNQVAQVATPEGRLIQVQPFDRSLLGELEKAIINANLGVTPNNDGNVIRLQLPPFSIERRKEVVKELKKLTEDMRIAARNIRRDFNDKVKKAQKNKEISENDEKKYLDTLQKHLDEKVKEIDTLSQFKENEIMKV